MSRKYTVVFSILVAIQLLLLLYYMNIRTSLFYDEIWSYGLANSYDSPFLYENGFYRDKGNTFFNHWVDGRKFFEYITVQPNECFSYNKVYDNQMADLHPPLYYILLHTICSFFPDTFNRWHGQIICLIVFIFVQISLYKLSKQLFEEDLMAFFMCAYFGFSMAAVNNFIYIRMYCLVTLWYICITHIALKICKDNQIKKLNGWLLFVFGFLGFMTHNHFAVYYFCLCIGCGAYFIGQKNYNTLWRFAIIALLSFGAYFSIFPGIFKQATSLNYGKMCGGILGAFPVKTLLANMVMICNYTFAASIDKFFLWAADIVHLIGENISFLPVWLFLLIATFLEVFWVYKHKNDSRWIILAQAVSLYIVIISSYTFLIRSSIYLGRYLFSILPCFALLVYAAIYRFITLLKSVKYNKHIFFCFMIIMALSTHYASVGEWCYDIPPDREEIAERFRDATIIYAVEPDNLTDPLIHGKCQDFMFTRRVFPTRVTDIDEIFKAILECNPNDKNLIVLPANDSGKKIFKAFPLLINKQPIYEFTDNTNVCSFYVLSF